jgi:F0F1-type ATP synthase assembly protein I
MLLKARHIEAGMSRRIAALRLLGVGFYIGGCIFLGVFAGLWLDSRFNTEPVLVIVGLLLGLVVAFYGVYRMLLPLIGNKQDKENS